MNWPILCGDRCPGLWWFRVLGYGLRWKHVRRHPLLFTERVMGRGLRVGGWHFLFLGRR